MLLLVPVPTVMITAPSTQLDGQSLTLECSVTTVRGITSRVDSRWKMDNLVLETIEWVTIKYSMTNLIMYSAIYNISELNTSDNGRVYQCEIIVNTSPPVSVISNLTLHVTGKLQLDEYIVVVMCFCSVPTPTVSITPSGPIQGTMVGSPQDIQCTVSTVDGVELNLVQISWMGPEGETITNDSRVTISPTSGSGNNYSSSLQFMYLMEGDEGTYECNVIILETNGSSAVNLNRFFGK